MDQSLFLIVLFLIGLAGLLIGYFAAIALSGKKSEMPKLRDALLKAEQEKLVLAARNQQLETDTARTQIELKEVRTEKEASKMLSAKLEAESVHLNALLNTQKMELENTTHLLRKDFELLANRIFEEKSIKFEQVSRSSLNQILDPLKLRLIDFQAKVEDAHKDNIRENSGLRQEIKHLKETSLKMTVEAENLTKALKNDSKTQGNWGEMILESILENSGLVKDREYFLQKNYATENGKRLQPDVMVKLPGDKWIIIDSKVSLTAYEKWVNHTKEGDDEDYLKAHITSLKGHIKNLHSKAYQQTASGKNLDFILLFVPIEPAYLAALNADQTLFNFGYEKQIILVCPSTLIASLKIIATTWRHEQQNQNAIAIADRGKILLEKFCGFADDFEKLGDQISRSSDIYNNAMKKLQSGKGNLVWQAQQLQDLGIKSEKKLPSPLSLEENAIESK